MRLLRLLLVLPVVAGVAAWLVAVGGAAPETPAAPPVRADFDAARADEVAAHASRLRARLATMPGRPGATRNPFRFESHARPLAHAARTVVRDAAPLSSEPEAIPVAVRPELHLIGMAEDTVDGAAERTAVVSGLNQVYLVKEGEQIAMRFLVKRVGADAVEIEDLSDSTPIRLALR